MKDIQTVTNPLIPTHLIDIPSHIRAQLRVTIRETQTTFRAVITIRTSLHLPEKKCAQTVNTVRTSHLLVKKCALKTLVNQVILS